MNLATIDVVVIVLYAIGIFSLAQYVSREKAGHQKDTSDYFLASKNLPWWAIGASLIAAFMIRVGRTCPHGSRSGSFTEVIGAILRDRPRVDWLSIIRL